MQLKRLNHFDRDVISFSTLVLTVLTMSNIYTPAP